MPASPRLARTTGGDVPARHQVEVAHRVRGADHQRVAGAGDLRDHPGQRGAGHPGPAARAPARVETVEHLVDRGTGRGVGGPPGVEPPGRCGHPALPHPRGRVEQDVARVARGVGPVATARGDHDDLDVRPGEQLLHGPGQRGATEHDDPADRSPQLRVRQQQSVGRDGVRAAPGAGGGLGQQRPPVGLREPARGGAGAVPGDQHGGHAPATRRCAGVHGRQRAGGGGRGHVPRLHEREAGGRRLRPRRAARHERLPEREVEVDRTRVPGARARSRRRRRARRCGAGRGPRPGRPTGAGTSTVSRTAPAKMPTWSVVWLAPVPRSSWGRSAVSRISGRPLWCASSTAGCRLATAVPEVVTTATGRGACGWSPAPCADARTRPTARNAAERSSTRTCRRSRGAPTGRCVVGTGSVRERVRQRCAAGAGGEHHVLDAEGRQRLDEHPGCRRRRVGIEGRRRHARHHARASTAASRATHRAVSSSGARRRGEQARVRVRPADVERAVDRQERVLHQVVTRTAARWPGRTRRAAPGGRPRARPRPRAPPTTRGPTRPRRAARSARPAPGTRARHRGAGP